MGVAGSSVSSLLQELGEVCEREREKIQAVVYFNMRYCDEFNGTRDVWLLKDAFVNNVKTQ